MVTQKVTQDELLTEIITDRRYISAMDKNGVVVDLMVRSLMPLEKAYADFLYNTAFKKARKLRLPTKKECLVDAINKGLWTKDKDKLRKLYMIELDKIKKQKTLYINNKGKQIKFRTDMIIVQKKINALELEYEQFIANSAESVAKVHKANYIISRLILCIDGSQYWPEYADFLSETDSVLIASIIQNFNKLKPKTEKEIRSVARYGNWSIMWNTSKNIGEVLFNKPTTRYSIDQALLCYWSLMYDTVYESMDRPSDKIIEDDDALDQWFENQKEKTKSTQSSSSLQDDVFDKHQQKGASQQEQFIMVGNELEAHDVYDMNDKWSLAQIRSETQRIEKEKSISEYELRKNKITRELTLQNSTKFAEARKGHARGGGFLG